MLKVSTATAICMCVVAAEHNGKHLSLSFLLFSSVQVLREKKQHSASGRLIYHVRYVMMSTAGRLFLLLLLLLTGKRHIIQL